MISRFLFLFCILVSNVYAQDYSLQTILQQGHRGAVIAGTVSSDGEWLVTGSRDRSAILWNVASGAQIRSFTGHTFSITALAILPGNQTLLSGDASGMLKAWNMATGELLWSVKARNEVITSLSVHTDGTKFISGGYDREAIVWTIDGPTELHRIKVNPDKGTGGGVQAQFTDQGLIIGQDNGMAVRYDEAYQTLDTLRNLPLSWCGGCPTSTSTQDKEILTGSNKGPITLWNPSKKKIIRTYNAPHDDYTAVELHASENYVLGATEDSVWVWGIQGNEVATWAIKGLRGALFLPNTLEIITLQNDNVAVRWNALTGAKIHSYEGFSSNTERSNLPYDPNSYWDSNISKYLQYKNAIYFTSESDGFFEANGDRQIRLWDLQSGRIQRKFRGHESLVTCLKTTNDGKYLLSGSADKTALLWNIETGDSIRSFKGHREPIFDLDVSADGQFLVTASWDGTAKLWDISTGKNIKTYDFEQGSPFTVRFLRNGLYIAIGRLDKNLIVIETDTGEEVRNLVGHNEIVTSLDISSSGELFSAGWDGSSRTWELSSGLLQEKEKPGVDRLNAVAVAPSGKLKAYAGDDRNIYLLDRTTGKVKILKGHNGAIINLKIDDKEQYLLSSSLDGSTRLWNLKNGKEIFAQYTLDDLNWLVSTPNGYFEGSPAARSTILFVQGFDSFSVDRFFEKYYQPQLIPKAISQELSSQNVLDNFQSQPSPELGFVSPASSGKITSDKMDVVLKVTDKGAGVREVILWHNGKRIPSENFTSFSKKNGAQYVNFSIQAIGGNNRLEAVAINESGIESEKITRELIYSGEETTVTCHLFVVGINTYKNESLNLNYALPDAKSFSKLLSKEEKNLFSQVKLYSYYDKKATKSEILDGLNQVIETAGPNDVFIFYYAGHGSLVNGTFYFIPTENIRLYDETLLLSTGISAPELQDKLMQIKALKQLIVLDACQSGASTSLLAQRGALEEKALAQLSRSAGIHVLAASGSEQYAAEFAELGHGLFTYVLLQAMTGAADGSPKDGKVTIYELKSYIDDQVPFLSEQYKGNTQYPVTYSVGQDFPIIIHTTQ